MICSRQLGSLKAWSRSNNLSAGFHKVAGEVNKFPSLEVEGVHIGIETLSHARIEVVLGIREEELSAPHTAGSANADQPVTPVDRIHERAPNGSIGVLYEIGV